MMPPEEVTSPHMLDGIHGSLSSNMVMLVLKCHIGGKESIPVRYGVRPAETVNVLLSPVFLLRSIQYLLDSILITSLRS